jgi:hypothetical protein
MRKDERKSSNEAMIEFTNAHNFISVLPFFGGAQRVQAVAAIGVRRSHRLAHEYDSLPRILGLSGLLDEEFKRLTLQGTSHCILFWGRKRGSDLVNLGEVRKLAESAR